MACPWLVRGGEPAIERTKNTDKKTNSKSLRRRLTVSMVAVLVTFLAVVSATYAWYIYNTSRHTTDVRMAAGTGANLQISNKYVTGYGSAAVLESFEGRLNPVSTNSILGGFQVAKGITAGKEGQARVVVNFFGKSKPADYYHTSLYLRTNGDTTDIYISDIGFEDSDEKNPISSAIRVGFVVHEPGVDKKIDGEYIFAISDKKNPQAQYNTATGKEGYVIDSSKTDGTTVPFTPYTKDAYCLYNKDTGAVTLKDNSLKLCTISGDGSGNPGIPVEVEVYIWLEGCDEDCTDNLCDETLRKLAVSFAGIESK